MGGIEGEEGMDRGGGGDGVITSNTLLYKC